jgi:hypothetical protein
MADKLGDIGKKELDKIMAKNAYQIGEETHYSAKHKNALGDGDKKGKGTGNFMDTYNGGSSEDIEGSSVDAGSGRIANLKVNKYNEDNGYKAPEL